MPRGVYANHQGAPGPKLPTAPINRSHQPLSKRELEVARLRCEGLPAKDIATRLGVSYKTATVHLNNIHNKLGIHKVSQLVALRAHHTRVEGRIALLNRLLKVANNTQGAAVWIELFTSLLAQEQRTLQEMEDIWPATGPLSTS